MRFFLKNIFKWIIWKAISSLDYCLWTFRNVALKYYRTPWINLSNQKKERLIPQCIADAEIRGKKVSFFFQLRALFALHQLIGWSTHFLCGFFHHSPAVILHSPSLLRVRQPFVVLGLFFWSAKKLPFASVRMFLPLEMGIFLLSRVFSYEKSKWQRFSHSRSHCFFILFQGNSGKYIL